MLPPLPLTQDTVERYRTVTAIVQQSEANLPILAHLPARSLSGLGWQGAPSIDRLPVSTWAPPAMWYEPDVMSRERNLGRRTWLMPDQPPYSASLAVEAPAIDPRILPWQAYRYGAEAIWIEDAAALPIARARGSQSRGMQGLVYGAENFGLRDRSLPSIRLKRLRRGAQDIELLRLLEDNGQRLLAEELARQVVRWAVTDSADENLLVTRPGGWPHDPGVLRLARELILRELTSEFEPDPATRREQLGTLSRWGLMMNRADRVVPAVEGVRLSRSPRGLQAHVRAHVRNTTQQTLSGRWTVLNPPPGWLLIVPEPQRIPPGTRQPVEFDLLLGGLAYNTAGVYPFDLTFDTELTGAFPVAARLAVAACRSIERPPLIDGRLDDWPLAADNAAADFRLCSTPGGTSGGVAPPPALPTQAFFCRDARNLYISVRCTLQPGEQPLWQSDNTIPVEGMTPWGQDVVEILIDPRLEPAGTSADIYCLQVKPSGLLIATRGCRTEPPIGRSLPWSSGARVAVSVERDVWIVELSLPLEALGDAARHNPVWGFNITRLDARRGEYSSWSGARRTCYTPASLGNLLMLAP